MRRIGIYAPYNRGETAAAACALADAAASLGLAVRWASPAPVAQKVHPAWDGRVRRARPPWTPASWAYGCDHCVWFEPDPEALAAARAASPGTGHAVVPSWHRHATGPKARALACYGRAVFPCPEALAGFRKLVFGRSRAELLCCPWDPGVGPLSPPRGRRGDPVRVLARFDGPAVLEGGTAALEALRLALAAQPRLAFTVARDSAWPRPLYDALTAMLGGWGDRLRYAPRLSPAADAAADRAHDWTWLPAARSDFGLWLLRSQALGVPALAYDVPPFRSCLAPGGGSLVPCGALRNAAGAPAATPDPATAAAALAAGPAAPGPPPWPDAAWLRARRRAFVAFWAGAWGVPDPAAG